MSGAPTGCARKPRPWLSRPSALRLPVQRRSQARKYVREERPAERLRLTKLGIGAQQRYRARSSHCTISFLQVLHTFVARCWEAALTVGCIQVQPTDLGGRRCSSTRAPSKLLNLLAVQSRSDLSPTLPKGGPKGGLTLKPCKSKIPARCNVSPWVRSCGWPLRPDWGTRQCYCTRPQSKFPEVAMCAGLARRICAALRPEISRVTILAT